MYHERKFYCRYSFTVILHEKNRKDMEWHSFIWSHVSENIEFENFSSLRVSMYRATFWLNESNVLETKPWKKKCYKLDFLGNETSLLDVPLYYFSSIFSRNNFIHFFTYNHPFLNCTIITGTFCIAITII